MMTRAFALVSVLGLAAPAAAVKLEPAMEKLAGDVVSGLKLKLVALPDKVMMSAITGDKEVAPRVTSALQKHLLAGGLKIVDKQTVNQALSEAGLQETQGSDSNVMSELAVALGAPVILLGSLGKLDGVNIVNVTAVDVLTGQAIIAADAKFVLRDEDEVGEAFALDTQLRRLSDALHHGLDKLEGSIRYQRFAVLPFEDVGAMTKEKQLGTLVSSQLTTLLSRDHGLLMVERTQLTKVLGELQLGQSGLADESKSIEVGKLSGAQGLILGTVAEAGDRFICNARVVSTQTGQVIVAEEIGLPATDVVSWASDAVELRTVSGAVYRSLILPGWGQQYNRQFAKGMVFVGIEALAAGVAAYFHFVGQGQEEKYNTAGNKDFTLADKASANYTRRNQFALGVAILHALNVADAAMSGKTYDSPMPGGS